MPSAAACLVFLPRAGNPRLRRPQPWLNRDLPRSLCLRKQVLLQPPWSELGPPSAADREAWLQGIETRTFGGRLGTSPAQLWPFGACHHLHCSHLQSPQRTWLRLSRDLTNSPTARKRVPLASHCQPFTPNRPRLIEFARIYQSLH